MSVATRIEDKVRRLPKGRPLPLRFFMSCGSGTAVRTALSRLVKDGLLVNVAQGIYARPEPNAFFGTTLPGVEEIARVIAEERGEQLAPHGAEIARRLGLSTQMPVQAAFYTSGRTRRLRAGKATIHFEHAPERLMEEAGSDAGQALLALHYLGRSNVTPEVLDKLNRRVPARKILESGAAPNWLHARLRRMETETLAPQLF